MEKGRRSQGRSEVATVLRNKNAPQNFAATRSLTPLDFLRFVFWEESAKANRAHTLKSLAGLRSSFYSLIRISRSGLSIRGRGCAWALSGDAGVIGVAAARQRSGPQSWEITHLFAKPASHRQLPLLLDSVSTAAAAKGGERVFIRLSGDDPLIDVAKLSGYFPQVSEVLFQKRLEGGSSVPMAGHIGSSGPFRDKAPKDDHDLFRMYNAVTPPEIRFAVGMTLESWMASRERPGGKSAEVVMEGEDGIAGLLRYSRRPSFGLIEAVTRPERRHGLGPMVEMGLLGMSEGTEVYCLVPEYQVELQSLIVDKGFRAVADYVTLVKSLTVKDREKSRLRASVPSV